MDIKFENHLPIKQENSAPKLGPEQQRDLQLREKSREMEAIFIGQLFKAMEKTVGGGITGDSKNNLSSMMFSSVMGKAVANQGGIGLSEMIYQSLAKNDGGAASLNNSAVDEIDLLSKIEYLRLQNE